MTEESGEEHGPYKQGRVNGCLVTGWSDGCAQIIGHSRGSDWKLKPLESFGTLWKRELKRHQEKPGSSLPTGAPPWASFCTLQPLPAGPSWALQV